MQADEDKDELALLGSFGANPGSDGGVTVEDGASETPLPIKSWASDTIRVTLPRTGQGSSGNVVVTVRGHKSNARQLLAWQGTFRGELVDAGTLNDLRIVRLWPRW